MTIMKQWQAKRPALFGWLLGYKSQGYWMPRYDADGNIYMWLKINEQDMKNYGIKP